MSAPVLEPDAPADVDDAKGPSAIGRRRVLAVLGGGIGLAACSNVPQLPVPGMPGAPPAPPSAMPSPSPTPGAPPPPTAPAPPPPATGGPVPTVRANDTIVHLLNRATFGPTNDLVERVGSVGIEAWLDEQLAGVDDGALEGFLDRYGILNASAQQIENTEFDNGGREAAFQTLQKATLFRQVFSANQLHEKLIEFFHDHFSIAGAGDPWGLMVVEDRELYRGEPGVLGKFADLLSASAKSPAMMWFLNQDISRGDGDNVPNENYAREFLELHTHGAARGYTEQDVREVARLFTGLTRTDQREFRYDANRHYVGELTIMGETYANADQDALELIESFIAEVARHDETATYLAEKLVQTFVADDVATTGALVANLAQVYLDNDTAIVPVVKALFLSPEFNAAVGQKVRRPTDRVAGAIRALGLELRGNPEDDDQLVYIVGYMQHLLGAWPTPDGYPKQMQRWLASGGLVASWNFYNDLVNGSYGEVLSSDDEAIQALVQAVDADTAGALLDGLAERLVFQPISAADRTAVLSYVGLAAGDALGEGAADVARGLALALFSSPYHLQQ